MAYEEAVRLLEGFERTLEAGSFGTEKTPGEYARLRRDLWRALDALTVWHRPQLESGPGLNAPYAWLRRTGFRLERLAADANPALREQARLTLTLLPYPSQWRRLASWPTQTFSPQGTSGLVRFSWAESPPRAGEPSDSQAEMTAFFQKEQEKLDAKRREKADRIFRIRHFMQILKKPKKDGEKGVLRLFSLPYLVTDKNLLAEISRRFVLFVEPPMGVVWRHSWWRFFCALEEPCLFGVGGTEDAAFLTTQDGAVPVPLAHGDFLEDLPEAPAEGPKDFHIVFNATFDDMARKRHGLMLDLLNQPELSNMKALFLGRGRPENVALFQRHVADRSLKDRVAVCANVRRSDVPGLLALCRLGVHLSLYENACRAVMEYFRSNLPCIVSASTAGMRPELFNAETGAAVPDARLGHAIAEALENLHRYAPRRWFLRESGSRVSSHKLNAVLRSFFLERGMPWTEDIVRLTSSGASRYASASDEARFRDEHLWIAGLLQGTLPPGFQVVP
jgi:glycosyltransferase involved in cell wall biosynthesis